MRPVNRAFTLVDTLLAIAISGMVGATTVMMLIAISNATEAQHDVRTSSVKRQVVFNRLSPLLRDACRVLGYDADHVVLWVGDLNHNARPELSELRLIEWWGDRGEVWVFEAPDDLDAAADTTYTLSDDFSALTDALAGSPSLPGRLVLREAIDFHVQPDQTTTAAVRAVRLEVTMAGDSASDTSVIIAALRAAEH